MKKEKSKEEIYSLDPKWPPKTSRWKLSGDSRWPPDVSRRQGSQFSSEKKAKDDDNRLRQERISKTTDEDTEIKRRYGGEENEEKYDLSKEDYEDSCPSLVDDENWKQRFETDLCDAVEEQDEIQKKSEFVEDNKTTEDLENRIKAVVAVKDLTRLLERTESMEKDPPYFDNGLIVGLREDDKYQMNNFGRSFDNGETSFSNTAILESLSAMTEGNFLFPTWNISPSKTSQKHFTNIMTSLKDEFSSLVQDERLDNKVFDNKLMSLWAKMTSILTPRQIGKITAAIGMKKGTEDHTSVFNCFNLLSKGGDLVLQVESEGLDTDELPAFEKDSDVVRPYDVEKGSSEMQKEDIADEDDDCHDHDEEKEKKLEEYEVKDAFDKAQCEDMEKENLNTHLTSEEKKKENVFLIIDDDPTEGDTITDKCLLKENGRQQLKSKPKKHGKQRGKDSGGSRFQAHLKLQEPEEDDPESLRFDVPGYRKGKGRYSKMKRIRDRKEFATCPTSIVNMVKEERVDLRMKLWRTRSCMDCGSSGGGNSQSSNHGDRGSNARGHSRSSSNGNDDQNFDGGESSDNPNNHNNNNNSFNNPKGEADGQIQPHQQIVNKNIPGQDYKAFRKKHAQMSDAQLLDLLGSLSPDTGPSINEDPVLLNDINECLKILLHELPTNSDLSCSVCVVLHSLLSHFATCQLVYMKCTLCWQLLRLCLYHVQKCIVIGKEKKESQSDVCQQLIRAANHDADAVETNSKRLWTKMKKYVISVFHPQGLHASGQHGMYCPGESVESMPPGSGTQSLGSPSIGTHDTSSIGGASSIGAISSGTSSIGAVSTGTSSIGAMSTGTSSIGAMSTGASSIGAMSTGASSMRVSSIRSTRDSIPLTSGTQNAVTSQQASTTFSNNGGFVRTGSKKFQSSLPSIAERPAGFPRSSRRSRTKGGTKGSIGGESEPEEKESDSQLESSLGELEPGFLPTPTDQSSTRSSFGANDDSSVTSQNEEKGQTAIEFIYKTYKPLYDKHGNIFPTDLRSKPAASTDAEFPKTYGPTGVMSLPPKATNPHEGEQMMSLVTAPTGEPGIGEVVYGTRRQIMKVARYWGWVRDNIGDEKYKHQLREEGVILDSAKRHLRILKTRYQKKRQWMRLVHLGNGVAGKCHLAHDTTSDFKFCVKRIHIAKYEENELVTWSDLDHTNIVKLYGAIRHGCKVYIFCEFIAGGSLTSLINEQRSLNRRLSHWMCLRYFKQLLQVLVYLKSRNVLHEDLKADNILIKRNTTLIAVTDFGLARRMNVDSEMKGMVPTGTQSQWSPEKATSNGHGFAADVWAAVCILVHMLSGHPPWTKRYPAVQMLHFVIYTQSPPLADVPANIQEVMRDIITQAFTVDPTLRPSAADLLNHRAFQILDQGAPDSYYSTLRSGGHVLPNNMLDSSEEGPQEMEQILASVSVNTQHSLKLGSGQLPSLQRSEKPSKLGENVLHSSLEKPSKQSDPKMVQNDVTVYMMFTGSMENPETQEKKSEENQSPQGNVQNSTENAAARCTEDRNPSLRRRDDIRASNQVPSATNTDEESALQAAGGIPQDLWDSMGNMSSQGYSISMGCDDPSDCFHSFLNDDLSVQMTPTSTRLKEYQPPEKVTSKSIGLQPSNFPEFGMLFETLTFSGINLDDDISSVRGNSNIEMPVDEQNPVVASLAKVPEPSHKPATQNLPSGESTAPSHVPLRHASPQLAGASRDSVQTPNVINGTPRAEAIGYQEHIPTEPVKPPRRMISIDQAIAQANQTWQQNSPQAASPEPFILTQTRSPSGKQPELIYSRTETGSTTEAISGTRQPFSPQQAATPIPQVQTWPRTALGVSDSRLPWSQDNRSPQDSSQGAGHSYHDHGSVSRGMRFSPDIKPLTTEIPDDVAASHPKFYLGNTEDPYPTSYYPPTGMFEEEHIDSGDLFGDPETQALLRQSNTAPAAAESPRESPSPRGSPSRVQNSPTDSRTHLHPILKTPSPVRTQNSPPYKTPAGNAQTTQQQFSTKMYGKPSPTVTFPEDEGICNSYTSLETNIPSVEDRPVLVKNTGDPGQGPAVPITKPRSASAPKLSMVYAGMADYAIESQRNDSEDLDLPDDIKIGDEPFGEEKTAKKKLTLDCNLKVKKTMNRHKSQPAVGSQTAVEGLPHPKTCPGNIGESYKNSFPGKKAESSSGVGTSYSTADVRQLSTSSNEVFGPVRISSSEMSPSTPKSLYDHQEKEFIKLEATSESNKSGHDEIFAMADLQDGTEDLPAPGSFEEQLASIQKMIPDEPQDVGHKYQLYRDDKSPLSPIRVPPRLEMWPQVVDLIRQVVSTETKIEHFTLKDLDDNPVDYNAPLTKDNMDLIVCAVDYKDVESPGCWCEHHEDMLRAMA